jgi:hypothetical protein
MSLIYYSVLNIISHKLSLILFIIIRVPKVFIISLLSLNSYLSWVILLCIHSMWWLVIYIINWVYNLIAYMWSLCILFLLTIIILEIPLSFYLLSPSTIILYLLILLLLYLWFLLSILLWSISCFPFNTEKYN